MTSFLFYSDAHVGAGQRIPDQIEVLDHITQLANDRSVDAVLFGGDATHHRSVVEEIAVFQDHLRDIDDSCLPYFAVAGNHDRSTMNVPSTLEVAAAGFACAKVADRPMVLGEIGGVAVCALPWAPTAAIAAMDPTGQHDEVVRSAVEILMDCARGLRASVSGPAVLLLHWSVAGAETPTGALTDEFREVVLPANELAEMGWTAVLCGHIHKAQMIGRHAAPMLYAGSPAVCDFGEADTAHGCWIIDVDEHGARCEFCPLPDRRFLTVGKDDVLTDGLVEGAIVRVRYDATPDEEQLISHEQIKESLLLAGAHRVHSIEPSIVGQSSTRTAITEEVDVEQALAMWLDGQEVDDREEVLSAHTEIREATR